MIRSDIENALGELLARKQISDALVRYCRGMDRCDEVLVLSAYHDGAYHDHGAFKGDASAFATWATKISAESFISTAHYTSNEYVVLSGNAAKVESYIFANMRQERNGELWDLVAGARYLDDFEFRDDRWAIVRRTVISDWDRLEPVVPGLDESIRQGLTFGIQGRSDASYVHFRRHFGHP
jgi:hypothetical protein